MPPNTLYVGRAKGYAGRFGNPVMIVRWDNGKYYLCDAEDGTGISGPYNDKYSAAVAAVLEFRAYVADFPEIAEAARKDLKGKNQACWCRLDQPCHADVLLEIANQ